jgi:uncharacterized RDD family membrane protein YckC
MTGPDAQAGVLQTPALQRRLLCMLYEGVLLFGVVAIAALLFALVTDQRHALVGRRGLMSVLFVVLGMYFVYFWSTSGQTLPMQTWHIRLVTRDGARVPALRALARYVCAWLWFLPAPAVLWAAGGLGGRAGPLVAALLLGGAVYGGLALLHPHRQFWHDALCGTRLVIWRPRRAT